MTARYFAIIPAAGQGTRMAALIPKQYLKLQQGLVLEHSISTLIASKCFTKVVVGLAADDVYWPQVAPTLQSSVQTIPGGKTRSATVLNALYALKDQAKSDDWVCVHDAARPCLTLPVLKGLLETVGEHPVGGILAIPIQDTLKYVNTHHIIQSTINREQIWQAQTPQLFRFGLLVAALEAAQHQGLIVTDEAQALEYRGAEILIVPGERSNLKLTYPDDLALADWYLSQQVIDE